MSDSTKKCWINGEQMDRAQIAVLMVSYGIPEHCRDGLAGYLTGDYKHVGHFLTALLSNDLKETFARADDENQLAIQNYIGFLYSKAPSVAWGSPERVRGWLARDMEQVG